MAWDVAGGSSTVTVSEYMSFGAHKMFSDAISGAIQLPVRETPEFNTTDFSKWVNVVSWKATPSDSKDDDLKGIQDAIDQGKPIVYLPQGSYEVSNTIVVRGSVQKVMGLSASISKKEGFPAGAPLIRFDGGAPDFTILQNLRLGGDVQHNSAKTLVITNTDINGAYGNTAKGTGNLYLEDTIGPAPFNIQTPQRVWARQLNVEFHGGEEVDYITNNKSTLWILGYKTEGIKGSLLVNNGGWAELLGGFFYPNNGNGTDPMIINNGGSLSASYKKDDLTGNNYPIHVRDIRGSDVRDFKSSDAPDANNCALYSGAKAKYTP
ncbi:hypothetical protein JQX13_38385 [Archangium violaceum]|uniref:hypothetical protein n=1 Tax=Archangium violaceum TaxID=83451 RepID=UPI00193B5629|nr:hypothetical protein [Archangium violaceum]QRK05960.1 hypothetical protein JQX13_38385 [Archangium violaceum]